MSSLERVTGPLKAALLAASLAGLAVLTSLAIPGSAAQAAGQQAEATRPATQKILRVSFPVAETGFDPAQINDLYSRTVTPHIFEGLYRYSHLKRPVVIEPQTAQGMPDVSPDFRTWTVHIKPGIYFPPDEAFKRSRQLDAQGRRELVAQDYVYSFKRFADPVNKSPVWTSLLDTGLVGLDVLRKKALDSKKPFDYDTEIEGVRALDRYTIQFRTNKPRPQFLETLAGGDLFGAVAREVVEHYGEQIPAHPVGTGPFRLAQWRRSSFIALERNPHFREQHYAFEASEGDEAGLAIAQRLKGRRIPLVDRVEISIIEEQQPRWLTFLKGELDVLAVPAEFINQAVPRGVIAPNLAKRGITSQRVLEPSSTYTYFNMEDPTVGGYEPHKVALRRAIGLGTDVGREIRLIRRGQAVPAQSPIVPHTTGYAPEFKSEMSDYDPGKARALLDLHGYVDRDGDGWREKPDGSPLLLEIATQGDQTTRQLNELRKRDMDALGIRTAFRIGKWPEQLKAARAGKLMVWALGGMAAAVDGQQSLARFHSAQAGGQNFARFRNDEMDRIYDRMSEIPDGPEREALFLQAKRIALAYMPYKFHVHRIATDLVQPRLVGYRRPTFWQEWWHLVDIDESPAAAH